ncbi:MAG TPA: hypothetical protein VK400_01040 [Pyrinomonadaceae bacterium]|nr:hypothetical protein [Pyrinomonadaceae bacterium]
MQRDTSKTIIAFIAAVYFLWCAYDPPKAVFPHLVHTPIHEAGHVLFRLFGEFTGVAGGSLFQVIAPLVFFGYFLYHRKPFSASIVLFWVGQSITDVYVYAADAVVMQLPLLSGLTGAEGGFHDWNYLLTETGLLHQTPLIAKIIRSTGTLIIFAAIPGSFLYAVKGEEILTADRDL